MNILNVRSLFCDSKNLTKMSTSFPKLTYRQAHLLLLLLLINKVGRSQFGGNRPVAVEAMRLGHVGLQLFPRLEQLAAGPAILYLVVVLVVHVLLKGLPRLELLCRGKGRRRRNRSCNILGTHLGLEGLLITREIETDFS